MKPAPGRHRRRRPSVPASRLRILALLLLLIGYAPLFALVAANAATSSDLTRTATQTESTVGSWPDQTRESDLRAATAYNEWLASSGQTAIGGVYDGDADGGVDYSGGRDTRYRSLLDGPQDIMATIRIPRIDVTLPVRHGSDDTALANGAGHLYGTSLPVGGPSTHSVITAHRGVPGKLLFTRLDELRVGDPIYVTVLGTTLAYTVTETHTVRPDDTSLVRIRPGRDLLTLLTCTPYGVNTERLLVTAERARIPMQAPEPEDAETDDLPRTIGLLAAGGVCGVGFLCVPPRNRLYGRHIAEQRN